MHGREVCERTGGRPRGERVGDEHRAAAGVRAHVLTKHRPEKQRNIRKWAEHAKLRKRERRHA